MTVTASDNKIILSCDGVLTDFDFSFKYLENSNIKVYVYVEGEIVADSDLVVEGVDYTLSSTDINLGGTVSFGTAPLNTKAVLIWRTMPVTQETRIRPSSNFPEIVVENIGDKVTLICQDLLEKISRCLSLPLNYEGDPITLPAPDAGKSLKWNTTEDALINTDNDPDEMVNDAAASALDASTSATEAAGYTSSASISATNAGNASVSAYNSSVSAAQSAIDAEAAAMGLEDLIPVVGNQGKIPRMATPYTDGYNFDTITQAVSGTCSTTTNTAEKVVTATGFILTYGAILNVIFSVANSAATPTLKVNAEAAKPITQPNGQVNPNLVANVLYSFMYNGTSFINITAPLRYISTGATPVLNTPTVFTHNLGLAAPHLATYKIWVRNVSTEHGYSAGEYASRGCALVNSFSGEWAPLEPYPTANTIVLATGSYGTGLGVCIKTTGTQAQATLAKWVYLAEAIF